MPVFKSRFPDVEVIGQTIYAVVDGMGMFREKAIEWLKEAGIEDLKPDQFYSEQAWLDSFKKIYDKLGKETLKRIGSKWPTNIILPPEISSVEQILESLDHTYSINQKRPDPGRYTWQKTSDREGILKTDHPYPCALDHGVIEGFVEKFKEPTYITSVIHLPEECRMRSGDVCKFKIKW